MRFAAVIAAAGLSSRMREFKPMMCLGEETIIRRVIKNFLQAEVEEIVVVVGYKADILAHHLQDLPVKICRNEQYAATKMFDSISMGLKALESDYDYVWITPGDVPLVAQETLKEMKRSRAEILCPMHKEKSGHPVMIHKKWVGDILRHDGKGGLRGALEGLHTPIEEILVDDIGILLDADTPKDYRLLRAEEMKQKSAGRLWPSVNVHIAKGDTILNPEIAQFLEMIDHTGSIQSACGCMHMSYTKGWNMLNRIEKELGYPLMERMPGGACGGGSILTEKGKRLLMAYQSFQAQLKDQAQRLFEEIFVDLQK